MLIVTSTILLILIYFPRLIYYYFFVDYFNTQFLFRHFIFHFFFDNDALKFTQRQSLEINFFFCKRTVFVLSILMRVSDNDNDAFVSYVMIVMNVRSSVKTFLVNAQLSTQSLILSNERKKKIKEKAM